MDNITIISYSGSKDRGLLSLTESRSRYMLPFVGRFRVVDFTIRNSIASKIQKTIIYNNCDDDLQNYIEKYSPYKYDKRNKIIVITKEYLDIQFYYNLIQEYNTSHYIIYNGDNPSIIDFIELIKIYKKKRTPALLFKIKINGIASRAHTILIINQQSLMNVIKSAIDENRSSPNIFEMIINLLINKGIKNTVIDTYYWPINSIPEYYSLNMEIMKDQKLAKFLHNDASPESSINEEGLTRVGINAYVNNSYISDSCEIFGTVKNSILFPGVEIGEKTVVEDSIILPFVKIGSYSRLKRIIIDERTEANESNNSLNIGNNCHIGSKEDRIKNNDYSKSLYRGVTLLGKDCHIPEDSRIGGACYIGSGMGEKYFSKRRYLHDGLSIIKK
ncbi:MAG: hypothetical protein SVR08_01620 [Spirochaetota bacterium]|nr:hypothetical protein [Spirochaetota bacterium]